MDVATYECGLRLIPGGGGGDRCIACARTVGGPRASFQERERFFKPKPNDGLSPGVEELDGGELALNNERAWRPAASHARGGRFVAHASREARRAR